MDLNKFTQKSQEAIAASQTIAIRHGHQQADAEHLMAALLEQENGLCIKLLEKAGYDPSVYTAALDRELSKLPRVSGPGGQPGQVYVTQRLNAALVKALELAGTMQDEYVSVEHLFLTLLEERTSTGLGRVNDQFKLDRDKILQVL